MNQLPILNIKEFKDHNPDATFYANYFPIHLELHHKSIMVPHKHDFYLTVLFTQGTGVHEIDFYSYQIKPGSVFLLNPGQTHHWELSEDIDGYIFFHSKSFYEMSFNGRRINSFPFFYSTQNAPCVYLGGKDQEKIDALFKEVVLEYQSFSILKRQKLANLIDIIYIELSRLCIDESKSDIKKTNSYSIKFRELEELIEKNFLQEKSPQFYASESNISPKHLNRITKEMVEKTTTELITERVILEAKRLLIHGKLTFTEIAYNLGYEDYSYFSRLFKKKVGENPSVFQSRYLD